MLFLGGGLNLPALVGEHCIEGSSVEGLQKARFHSLLLCESFFYALNK